MKKEGFLCVRQFIAQKTCFHCYIDLFALFRVLVLTIFIVEVERLEWKSRANPCYLKNHRKNFDKEQFAAMSLMMLQRV